MLIGRTTFLSPHGGGASGPSNRPSKPIRFAPEISFQCTVSPDEERTFNASLTAIASFFQELVPLIQNPKNLFAIYVTDDVRKTFDELMSHRSPRGVDRIDDPGTQKLSGMSLCLFNDDPNKSTFIVAIDIDNLKSIPEACATIGLEFAKIIISHKHRMAFRTVAEIIPMAEHDLSISAYEMSLTVLNLLLESSKTKINLELFTDELTRIVQREEAELQRWLRVRQAAQS